jgi:hypothetical protein
MPWTNRLLKFARAAVTFLVAKMLECAKWLEDVTGSALNNEDLAPQALLHTR